MLEAFGGGRSPPSLTKLTSVEAKMNDPADRSTSWAISDSDGHGSDIFPMSRRFCSYTVQKRERKYSSRSSSA